jgi:hypothetical protein
MITFNGLVAYSVKQGDLVTTLEAGLATVRIHSVVWSHSSTSILAGGEVGFTNVYGVSSFCHIYELAQITSITVLLQVPIL